MISSHEDVGIHCRDCGAYGSASGTGIADLLRECPACGGVTVRSDQQAGIRDWRPHVSRSPLDSMGREN